MRFVQGEIWLVDFEPSIGHEYQKRRPAVIVSSNRALHSNKLIAIVPITSSDGNSSPYDITVKKDATNELYKDSIVKVDCLTSFDRKRFVKKIGQLKGTDMIELIHSVRSLFND